LSQRLSRELWVSSVIVRACGVSKKQADDFFDIIFVNIVDHVES
jgi:hypothetical protein